MSNSLKPKINEAIRANEVRVVHEDGWQEVMRLSDAINKAREKGVDLIEVQPNATPPICKLMNKGKYLYEQEKREKEQKKKQKNIPIKEIRFHPNIDDHDFDFKVAHAEEFLIKLGKVRITIVFAGRQIVYKEQGYQLLERIAKRLDEVGKMETPAKLEGKFLSVIYIPEKHKVDIILKKREKEEKEAMELEQKDKEERARKMKEAEERRKMQQ